MADRREELFQVRTGEPHPLGATYDGEGDNFAIYSKHASAVELCLIILQFRVPPQFGVAPPWQVVVDTAALGRQAVVNSGDQVTLVAKSLVTLRCAVPTVGPG
jgi:pullulanase/glycogen debranching enzyme